MRIVDKVTAYSTAIADLLFERSRPFLETATVDRSLPPPLIPPSSPPPPPQLPPPSSTGESADGGAAESVDGVLGGNDGAAGHCGSGSGGSGSDNRGDGGGDVDGDGDGLAKPGVDHTDRPQSCWEPASLNPTFRICRYQPGGHFAPHHDGGWNAAANFKSRKTLMLYLNDGFEGGGTRFFDERQQAYASPNVEYQVDAFEPKAGACLIFDSDIMHDGQRLQTGTKYIMRSEVMFAHCGPSDGGESLEMTPEEEAEWVRRQEELAAIELSEFE